MNSDRQRWLIPAVKWTLFVVVLAFVCWKAASLWDAQTLAGRSLSISWLIASAVTYLVGWLPSVWFWRRLMGTLGSPPSWWMTARAYYCGHLGKYVPGKAAVLVIRAGMLKSENVTTANAVISITIETLIVMGVGLALGLALAPFTLADSVWADLPAALSIIKEHPWPTTASILLASIVSMRWGAVAVLKLARRRASRVSGELLPEADVPLNRLIPLGALAMLPTWALHGLSLGCVLASIGAAEWSWSNYWLWTSSISAGSSLGFFVLFAPGGLGVREGLLILSLKSVVGGPTAVAAAALLRLVWLAAEALSSAVLFWGRPNRNKGSRSK